MGWIAFDDHIISHWSHKNSSWPISFPTLLASWLYMEYLRNLRGTSKMNNPILIFTPRIIHGKTSGIRTEDFNPGLGAWSWTESLLVWPISGGIFFCGFNCWPPISRISRLKTALVVKMITKICEKLGIDSPWSAIIGTWQRRLHCAHSARLGENLDLLGSHRDSEKRTCWWLFSYILPWSKLTQKWSSPFWRAKSSRNLGHGFHSFLLLEAQA